MKNVYSGLKKILIGNIIEFVGMILIAATSISLGMDFIKVILFSDVSFNSTLTMVTLFTISMIMGFVSNILTILGLIQATKDEPSFKNALVWMVLSFLVAIIKMVCNGLIIVDLADMITSVFSFFGILCTLSAIASIAEEKENMFVIVSAERTKFLLSITMLASVIMQILSYLITIEDYEMLDAVIFMLEFVIIVLGIIQALVYLKTLIRARKMLRADLVSEESKEIIEKADNEESGYEKVDDEDASEGK